MHTRILTIRPSNFAGQDTAGQLEKDDILSVFDKEGAYLNYRIIECRSWNETKHEFLVEPVGWSYSMQEAECETQFVND